MKTSWNSPQLSWLGFAFPTYAGLPEPIRKIWMDRIQLFFSSTPLDLLLLQTFLCQYLLPPLAELRADRSWYPLHVSKAVTPPLTAPYRDLRMTPASHSEDKEERL